MGASKLCIQVYVVAYTIANVQPSRGLDTAVKELVQWNGVCTNVDFTATLDVHSEQ